MEIISHSRLTLYVLPVEGGFVGLLVSYKFLCLADHRSLMSLFPGDGIRISPSWIKNCTVINWS